MTFLFDENLSPRYVSALRALGKSVTHVNEVGELGRGAPDDQIIRYLDRWDYRLISSDKKIVRTPHLRALLHQHRVGAYFLQTKKKGQPDLWELFVTLVRFWPAIEDHASQTRPPFTMLIHPNRGLVRFP